MLSLYQYKNDMWFVYIVEFAGGKLYTGITTNPERRILEHNLGTGAKSLRGKGPINVLYLEPQQDHVSAAKREREIKGWNRIKKITLIEKGSTIEKDLNEKGLP